jgi:hypothetical protein
MKAHCSPFARARPEPSCPRLAGGFLPRVKAADVQLVSDEGATVLRIEAFAAAGSAVHHALIDAAATPRLAWRWKVSRALERAAWGTRAGDDFAARVYVAFDLPLERLSFVERTKLRLARFVYGEDVPAAAICYVWANGVAPGTSGWNPYAGRVRMSRCVAATRARADGPTSRATSRPTFARRSARNPSRGVSGIAASSDTDQTLESATAGLPTSASRRRTTAGRSK